MATVLPNGYSRWVPTFTLDGSIKIFQTVFMVSNGVSGDAAAIEALMRTCFCTAGCPFVAGNMWLGFTLAKTETWYASGGDVFYNLNETAIVGSKAGSSSSPINTSTLMRKNTGMSGKRYRGRHMLPNLTVGEGNINQAGIIDSTGLATIQGQWNTAHAAVTATSSDLFLGHSVSEIAPTQILSFTALPKVGSMPHRIR